MKPYLLLISALGIGALASAHDNPDHRPAAAYLAGLPDGVQKSQFILDCTGCHTYQQNIGYPGGQPRARDAWQMAITRMVGMFGPTTSFPVIGPHRNAEQTAQWLSENTPALSAVKWSWPKQLEGKAQMREYLLPEARDLPHDVAVAGKDIVVTGMFTNRMYVVDAETGNVRTEQTPQPQPRAVEVDAKGNWWVVLGGPKLVARRSATGSWQTYDAGFYAHSVALAPDNSVWVNGHFTKDPELLRRIDPSTSTHTDYTVPPHPDFPTTTVPYEIRAAANGHIWMTELQGNRLVRLDPRSGVFSTWNMPTPASGPRRFDIDTSGVLWIPEYSANKLARFDARTQKFTEYVLPIKDALPYVVRYDAKRKLLWIGTGAADALLSFDPGTEQFRYYRLPAVDQMVRHIAIDPSNGDIWLAPGSSPGTVAARIVRVRPGK